MTAYYNDNDPFVCAWLRKLIAAGHLPAGDVDERSILDVSPDDLRGYAQCHFFAGIGGWPLALRLAGVPDDTPLWTGSAPCQPFSIAGRQLGRDDPRHLAPTWLNLIRESRPPRIFGEQVSAAIRAYKPSGEADDGADEGSPRGWLDDLFDALEGFGYACGATVLPACSVGAPHIRERLFFGASRLADLHRDGCDQAGPGIAEAGRDGAVGDGAAGGVADDTGPGRRPNPSNGNSADGYEAIRARQEEPGRRGATSRLADSSSTGLEGYAGNGGSAPRWPLTAGSVAEGSVSVGTPAGRSFDGGWRSVDWLLCRDGKWRPVEPGTFPLADGVFNRMGKLRGYGNAIVPQVGARFIQAFLAAELG